MWIYPRNADTAMIDLRNIETFFWVATLDSFRAAAEKLNTTQPSISQRIACWKARTWRAPVRRRARGVNMTAKGQELLSYAERMLHVRHEMVQAAQEQQAMSGTLRIGVAETIVQTWLPILIEQIHVKYPALVLEIEVDTTQALRAHLLSREIHVAFLMGPVLDPRIENVPLCKYPLAWVASPLLKLGREPLSLSQVAAKPIITYPSSSIPYLIVRGMLLRAGVSAPRMYGSASMSMIARMMQDCIGVSVITPVFLSEELAQGKLRILNVKAEALPELAFTASWLAGPDSHMAQVISEMAQRIAAQYGNEGSCQT